MGRTLLALSCAVLMALGCSTSPPVVSPPEPDAGPAELDASADPSGPVTPTAPAEPQAAQTVEPVGQVVPHVRSDGVVVAVVVGEEHYAAWRRDADGAWTAKAISAPLEVDHGAATAWGGDTFLSVGGWHDDRPTAAGWRYDAVQDAWTALPALPEPVADATLTAMADGAWILTGGRAPQPSPDDPPRVLAQAWILDAGGATWRRLPPMPTPRHAHVAVALADGSLLVAAGDDGRADERFDEEKPYGVAAALRLDAARGRWSKAGELPGASVGPDAVRLADGRVLIVGGVVEPIGVSSRTPALVDPAHNRFKTLPEVAGLGGGAPLVALADGRVWLGGGFVLRTDGALPFSVDAAFFFDPKTSTFKPAPSLDRPRHGHAALSLPDGTLLLLGGVSGPWPGEGGDLDVEPVPLGPSVFQVGATAPSP